MRICTVFTPIFRPPFIGFPFLIMPLFLLLSGLAALCCETVWLRRLSLITGSAGLSAVMTLGLYMAGLGLGGWWAGGKNWKSNPRGYGFFELFACGWALSFPWTISVLEPVLLHSPLASNFALSFLLIPPAFAHGATLPALGPTIKSTRSIAGLYAINTLGAVLGVLLSSFWWMPTFGIRGTEIIAAIFSAVAGLGALIYAQLYPSIQCKEEPVSSPVPPRLLIACGIAGAAAMSLEIVWTRLASLLIGGSVYSMAIVLAVFLLGISLGAEIGKRKGPKVLPIAMISIGLLALCGTFFWRILPHGLGIAWDIAGENSQLWAGALLLSFAMCGAPVASGVVFGSALQSAPQSSITKTSGSLLAANTLGSVLGVFLCGVWGMPIFGIKGMVLIIAFLCCTCAMFVQLPHKLAFGCTFAFLVFFSPSWDHAIYSVGIYNRIGTLNKRNPRYIERYAHKGWTLEYYKDGKSASVAVGKSKRTGNLWLSINGKVDASTGSDMPTQLLSGELPVHIAKAQNPQKKVPTLVVGLASGVTAAEAKKTGADPLDILEIEPAVVEAAQVFSSYNDNIVFDAKSNIIVQDARAHLMQTTQNYRVIISEPSNPWLTGVSNLFTVEYWRLSKSRLTDDGVFCQWVQLYNMPPDGFRMIIRSFLSVYPNTWLFETIPGADVLLISAPMLPEDLAIPPTLGPSELRALADGASLNTDDAPWIEFEAPKWLNRPTGSKNKEIIEMYSDPFSLENTK